MDYLKVCKSEESRPEKWINSNLELFISDIMFINDIKFQSGS